MEWIKVKVKHAEYDFATASDNVFRAWIMMMIYVAVTERAPTPKQLEKRLGKDNYKALLKHLKETKTPISIIIRKVLEDVSTVLHKRERGRQYADKWRSKHLHKSLRKGLRKRQVRGADKIREDKIRSDKIREDKKGGFVSQKPPEHIGNIIKEMDI